MDAKQRKKKFGVTMAPIPCTEAWRRTMPFDHNSKGVVTFSYILINRYTGTRTHVNTYNGDAGIGYNATKNTHRIKGWGEDAVEEAKSLAKALQAGKDLPYHRCKIEDCPTAELAQPPEGWTGEPILEPPLTPAPVVPPAPTPEAETAPVTSVA